MPCSVWLRIVILWTKSLIRWGLYTTRIELIYSKIRGEDGGDWTGEKRQKGRTKRAQKSERTQRKYPNTQTGRDNTTLEEFLHEKRKFNEMYII